MHKLVALAVLVACSGGKPPLASAPPATDRAVAPAASARSPILVVANKAEHTVSVLELPGGAELAKLPTGTGPHEVAIAPNGKRAVISNYGDQTPGRSLTVIDLEALRVASTIDLGEFRRPHGIAFLDGKHVVVTAEVNASIVVVDLDAGKVTRSMATSQKGSHMLTLSPDRSRVYSANMGSGTITPIEVEAGTSGEPVQAIATSEAIAITPDGKEVWTASLTEDKLVILDGTRGLARIAELPALGAPIRITPVPDGSAMLVSNVKASKLQLIEVATRNAVTIDIPATNGDTAAPLGSVVSTDSKTAYVALVAEDRVAVIDLATRAITGHLPVGKGPDGIAYFAH
jgi:YVTN family beta-propeller protein